MPKDGPLTAKAISNRMKSIGLQKLRWYCQMCQKQCRDENGFKCHTTSEGHLRQMRLFAENSRSILDEFSTEFERGYMSILSHRHGTKRVLANRVYQEYIADKHHVHMNSTQWESLTAFCKHLGKQGLAVVDETEKGWFVTYIDRDPKALERQARSEQVRKNELDEEERQKRAIEAQIAAAEAKKRELGIDLEADQEGNDYNAAEREALVGTGKVELSMKLGSIGGTNKRKIGAVISNAFAEPTGIHSSHDMDKSDAKGSSISDMSKRFRNTSSGEIEFEHATTLNSTLSASSSYKPKSNIESLMMQEEQRKSSMINQDDKQNRTDYWLHEGIVVKIINKNVAEGRFYKQKGVVVRVVDKYVGEVKVDGATLRLDQEHLETVIPKIGGDVLILNGRGRGQVATVVSINEADYNCDIKVHASVPGGASIYGGRVLQSIEYEDISKYAYAESSQN